MDEQVKEKETAKESSMLFWMKLQTCLTGAVLALLLIFFSGNSSMILASRKSAWWNASLR